MIIQSNSGIKIIVSQIPTSFSIAMGIYVSVGSAYEKKEQAGISHFVEHMLFKGTKTKTSFEVADSFEQLGSQVNAFTSKEMTCFYAKSTRTNFEKTFENLADIFCNSVFDSVELEREKGVILEEIAMYEDNAEEVCHDLLVKEFFGENEIARPIIGKSGVIRKLKSNDLKKFFNDFYTTERITIVFVGQVSESEAVNLVDSWFCKKQSQENYVERKADYTRGRFAYRHKEIEQANIAIGFPSVKFSDEYVMHHSLINIIFGGGMSSRFFQEIRERRGLAYSVYSFLSQFKDFGLNTLFIACNEQKLIEATSATYSLIEDFSKRGISISEFERAVESYRSAIIFGQENNTALMNAYGKNMVMLGKEFSLQEKLEKLDSIDFEQTNQLAKQYFDLDKRVVAVVANKRFSKTSF